VKAKWFASPRVNRTPAASCPASFAVKNLEALLTESLAYLRSWSWVSSSLS
jgi:hypothetical protein